MHDRWGEIWKLCDSVHTIFFVLCAIPYFLLFSLFWRKQIFSRFTRFCVEKNGAKNNVCGEKITLSGMGWVDLWVVGTGGHIWRRRLTPTTALYQTFSFLFTSLRLKIKRFLECILQCISSSVRIVQIEGHGCKLPSMIPRFDRSAQLKITGEANQESRYSKIGRILCIYLENLLSYLLVSFSPNDALPRERCLVMAISDTDN